MSFYTVWALTKASWGGAEVGIRTVPSASQRTEHRWKGSSRARRCLSQNLPAEGKVTHWTAF